MALVSILLEAADFFFVAAFFFGHLDGPDEARLGVPRLAHLHQRQAQHEITEVVARGIIDQGLKLGCRLQVLAGAEVVHGLLVVGRVRG